MWNISSARIFATFFSAILFSASGVFPAEAAVSDLHKGSSIYSWGPDDFGGPAFRQSLANLRAVHAGWVPVVISVYQAGMSANQVQSEPLTPTDMALREAIAYAHSLA